MAKNKKAMTPKRVKNIGTESKRLMGVIEKERAEFASFKEQAERNEKNLKAEIAAGDAEIKKLKEAQATA